MTHPPLYIHAGAHRTGTSSFQLCLHENRARLEAQGWALAYPSRDDIPSGNLALRLPRPRDGRIDAHVAKAARMLDNHSGGKPLILSEENIPGRMMHFMKGQFYPAAAKRCRVLRTAWSGPIAHVVLVVRPYDQLFVSGYRKRAEDNPVPSFDSLRRNYMQMDRGWPELVAVLCAELAPVRLTVLPYAARGASVDLLTTLVPDLAVPALQEPADNLNVSATDAALLALQARYAKGERINRATWQAVVANHAADDAPRGFAAFSAEEVAYWRARYDADLVRIAAMDGITLANAP